MIFDRSFKISDLDLNIKACTQSSVSAHMNSSLSVVRHEFLELSVRVALDKFYRSGVYNNEAEAIGVFFKKHPLTEILSNQWRILRYFNEECENVMVGNKKLLANIYDTYKARNTNNFDKKGIVAEDFLSLVQENGVINEVFSIRYAAVCFNLSLVSRVDEISNLDHMQASFLEFIEALARCSDLLDSNDIERDIFRGYSDSSVLLDKKLETIMENFSYLKVRKPRRR